jgi:cell division transport system permease protein
MLRPEYYLRETAAGIRRNGVVAFSAMSTAFIALFLVGLALLIWREFNVAIGSLTGNVEVAVYLTDPVDTSNLTSIQSLLQSLPAVASVTYWDKQVTCQHYHEIFAGNPAFNEDVNCEEAIPTSLRVKLVDTSEYAQIPAAMQCAPSPQGKIVCARPGVLNVRDNSSLLDALTTLKTWLSVGVLLLAIIMLVSAIALVSNTLRMGMFARRKEIGIMRLVGATNWHIRVPFLIEGLVETLLGAFTALIALFLVKVLFIDRAREHFKLFPLIRNSDVLAIAPWILIAAVVIAVLAGTIGMRRFLDV